MSSSTSPPDSTGEKSPNHLLSKRSRSEFFNGRWRYLNHVAAIVRPGYPPPVPGVHQIDPGDLQDWTDEDIKVLIEEGRRQFDRQATRLTDIRSRAQFIFGVSLVVAGTVIANAGPLTWRIPNFRDLLLNTGIISALLGLLGAASVITSTAELRSIDTAALSRRSSPVNRGLALSYATMISTGENSIAGRLTVLREAVVWLLLAAMASALLYLTR
jgi:hypothetical protein